ncbi:MAG TPA: T9SS type A sorting domain-containing protein, partial [Saprospiraceae bacterium]|nr:T9SS type A sorting domain-containing protein [Saprospiraceae bacterium]
VIDEIEVKGINLSTTANDEIALTDFKLFPNPGNGNDIIVEIHNKNQNLRFEIIDYMGILVQEGKLTDRIKLNSNIEPGTYYFLIYEKEKIIALAPYIVL